MLDYVFNLADKSNVQEGSVCVRRQKRSLKKRRNEAENYGNKKDQGLLREKFHPL